MVIQLAHFRLMNLGKNLSMKNFILIICLVMSQLAIAQITEDGRTMSTGLNNALILDMPGIETSFGDKLWKAYIKAYGKTKRSRSEWFTDDAKIAGISGSSSVDIYMSSGDSGQDTEMAVWFDLGDGFLNSEEHPDQFLEAEKFLMRFALYVAKEKTEVELNGEEKEMRRLESLLKRLERDNERYHREIEVAKEKIRQNEANIETNVVEQEEARKLIELQIAQLEKVKARLAELNN